MINQEMHDTIFLRLKPFVGAENCPENREKIRTLIKEILPIIDDRAVRTMMDWILR